MPRSGGSIKPAKPISGDTEIAGGVENAAPEPSGEAVHVPQSIETPVVGRPSAYTPDVASVICAQIAEGVSLRRICLADEMPALSTVFNWLHAHPEFVEQYARAREQQAEHFADELVEIADDTTGDAQRDRLRVDTRKWIASKLKPRKFADTTKHEHSGPNGGPVQTVTALEVTLVRPESRDT